MNAWIFQDHRQKQKLGDKTPWSVGWIDPDGKRRSKSVGSRSAAEKYQRKIEGQLAAGTYHSLVSAKWKEFRKDFESKILSRTSSGNQLSAKISFDHFERLCKPVFVRTLRTSTIDEYVALRMKEKGLRGGEVSPATINRELRYLRAALRKAVKWKYLIEMPDIDMLREPEKLPSFITPEHFELIYNNCNAARMPQGLPYPIVDWWQALIVFTYMTGWRISEPLALRRDDLNLEAGTAITRHTDNKGKRDDVVPLHPIVVEHLRKIQSFHDLVFPWPHGRRDIWSEFHRIQKTAGIDLPCLEKHEHTEACRYYGFHDLRRAFATQNEENLTAEALQRLMRHRHYSTTQRYINMARKLKQSADRLFVPDVLRRNTK